MKSLPISLLLVLGLLFSACSDEDDDDNTPSPNPVQEDPLAEMLNGDGWRITLFQDEEEDYTSFFADYNFTFRQDGTATATSGSGSVNGSWQIGTDDSRQKLILNFGQDDPWEELNEDWEVLEQSKTKIRLQDDDDTGDPDLLTFQR